MACEGGGEPLDAEIDPQALVELLDSCFDPLEELAASRKNEI